MKKIYIAPDFSARSGVSAYSRNFFEHVLKRDGFECLHFKSLEAFETWQRDLREECRYHIEVAVGTHTERAILWDLLDRGAVVDITLHDPPYIAFPHFRGTGRWVNQASKLLQVAMPQRFFGLARARRIRRIYTLSRKGCARTRSAYPGANVSPLPFICMRRPALVAPQDLALVFTGFIGKKKGLEYALRIHQALLAEFPGLVFKVVGAPLDEVTRRYFVALQERYQDQVQYLGYVDDGDFVRLLSAGHVVMLPTVDYGTICPVSANILDALTLGSVVVSTTANANAEFIEDGRNGRLLTLVLDRDIALVAGLLRDPELRQRMVAEAQARLARDHSPERILEVLRS